jgi:uncharacterized protein (UPF0335 family)
MKKQKQTHDEQPVELNELKSVVSEFLTKLQYIDNEIETLKEDRKKLIEDYSNKLDVKTLNAAIRYCKIKSSVSHKHTFDCFVEVIEQDI